jgi:hypothetical protein
VSTDAENKTSYIENPTDTFLAIWYATNNWKCSLLLQNTRDAGKYNKYLTRTGNSRSQSKEDTLNKTASRRPCCHCVAQSAHPGYQRTWVLKAPQEQK